MKTITTKIKLTGMHCPSCAASIDLSLEDISGIINVDTSYATSRMSVTYDADIVQQEDIVSEIEQLGYTATVLE